MRRLLRRRSANDRHLKLLARADQRKAELNGRVTVMRGDDQRLRNRGTARISRLDTNMLTHPNLRETLAPTWTNSRHAENGQTENGPVSGGPLRKTEPNREW